MHKLRELKDITQNCIVLCVDDDEAVLDFLRDALSDLFKQTLTAKNGAEGLEIFRNNKIDLVITDQIMPVMNGTDMIREIKTIEPKVPVIVMTAYAEIDILVNAINMDVTQFLMKPVKLPNLLNAIETAIQRVIVERQKFIQQEAELLRYKEKYNNLQQKLTFKKQQNIIQDDLYYNLLEINREGKRVQWLINMRYRPHDILSGDFYTVRKLGDKNVLLYIADAMGKGLNAFVTTAIVTSSMNFFIDNAVSSNNFDQGRFIDDFLSFAKKNLSQDEALCAVLVFVDFKEETLEVVNFAMPSLFIETCEGEILKIPNNSLPIMRFTEGYKIDRYELKGFKKMLICSDGVYDTSYVAYIEDDFRDSPFKGIFFNKFISRVKEPEDDATFIFLKRIEYEPLWTKTFVINSRLNEVQQLTIDIENFLTELSMDTIFIVEFINALSEVLMNAYEHGSLNITYQKKNRLVKEGMYEEHLLEIEKTINKKITTTLEAFRDSGRSFLCLRVLDEGEGFDKSIIKESVRDTELMHYRGIKIVKGIVDEIYYNDKGNEVILLKQYAEDNQSIVN